jgi:hypothetical protein
VEPCCARHEAAGTLVVLPEDQDEARLEAGIVVRRCPECKRRHVEMTVDPALIGVEVKSL